MCFQAAAEPVALLGGTLAWAPGSEGLPADFPGVPRAALSVCLDKSQAKAAGVYAVAHYPCEALGRAFGPLALPDVLLFCRGLDAALSGLEEGSRLVLTTPRGNREYRSNAAVLLGAYLVARHQWTPWQVESALGGREAKARFARSWSRTSDEPEDKWVLSVRDCWEGVALARDLRVLTPEMLQDDAQVQAACATYEHQVSRYDCTWIVPGMVMVGADPVTVLHDPASGTCSQLLPQAELATASEETSDGAAWEETLVDTVCRDFSSRVPAGSPRSAGSPEDLDYASFLQSLGVGLVLRANLDREKGMPTKSYKDNAFEPFGISHANVRVVDTLGGFPRREDFARIIKVAREFWERRPEGAVFLHCKGGFGRSVLFACCLTVERLDVSGRALLGWARIARPGAFTTRRQELFLAGLKGREDVRRAAGLRPDCGEVEERAATSCAGCAVQ